MAMNGSAHIVRGRVVWGISAVLALLPMGSVLQADARDPFAKANEATRAAQAGKPGADPFDPANKADIKVAQGEARKPQPAAPKRGVASVIDFEVSVTPKEVQPGQTVKLTITGIPKPGFHTYPLTQRTPTQEGRYVTRLQYQESPWLKPLWPLTETPAELVKEGDLGVFLEHKGKFTLSQDVLIVPETTPGTKTLKLSLDLQVCDDHKCIPGTLEYQVDIDVKGEPVKLSPELQTRLQQKQPEATVVAPPEVVVGGGGSTTLQSGLLSFVLAGIFWGGVSLLTPCVFPMIPITVSYFLKQSEKEHHRPLTMAVVYCATIIVVLTIAAVALLSFFRGLSTNPIMNIVIGLLFIFFALSLFGMYDIELPSGLARFTSAREGKGGLIGTMFMALTFTIISFACVAPFLGGFGGTAADSGLTIWHRVLGGLAFAGTFASPFFVLALFPALLKKMPKSGSWLNTVKVVMGFLELAAALKFLRTGELVLLSRPALFTYDFVLGLYIALSLLCGLYLLGVYRLPHDTPSEHLGVPRLLFSLAFLGLAFYLAPALFKGENGQSQRPAGEVFAWLDSFLLPEEQASDLPWVGDLKQGLETAKRQGKYVFVDFTGKTCTNCKLNERNVFTDPTVKDLLKQYSLVALYTDVVPDKFYPPAERAKLGNGTTRQRADAVANLQFQRKRFSTEQLPLYVILEPLANGEFREVGQYDEGRIIDQAAFIAFLQKPLDSTAGAGKVASAAVGVR
jgi:thiol:disulfide interchange protein DsbD